MANYSDIVYNILSNNATVASYVGDRIYPLVIAQGATFPAIQFRKRIIPTDVKGLTNCQDTIEVEINVVSETFDQCDLISQAIRTALDDTTPGSIGTYNVGKVEFQLQDFEMYDDDDDLYIIQSTYRFKINL